MPSLPTRDIVGWNQPRSFRSFLSLVHIGLTASVKSIQVLRYTEGQYYRWHSDEATDKTVNEYHRTISIVLYLSDGFAGGATEFPWGTYKPKAGQALVFPSNWCFPHQSQRLISGEKIAAVTWYHSHYDFDQKA